MKFILINEGEDRMTTAMVEQYARHYVQENTGIDLGDAIIVNNEQSRADGKRRMTFMQLLKLWFLCGNFNRAFNEEHYLVNHPGAGWMPGWIDGAWIGGPAREGERSTIVVGVSPEGDSHS